MAEVKSKQDEGPCFTCEHVHNHVTHGYCPMFNRDVHAMSGCTDFSESVTHFKKATWLDKLKIGPIGEQHVVQTA
jgi:hypothetical protein